VQFQQNARSGKRNGGGPGLIDLLDNVEKPVLDRAAAIRCCRTPKPPRGPRWPFLVAG